MTTENSQYTNVNDLLSTQTIRTEDNPESDYLHVIATCTHIGGEPQETVFSLRRPDTANESPESLQSDIRGIRYLRTVCTHDTGYADHFVFTNPFHDEKIENAQVDSVISDNVSIGPLTIDVDQKLDSEVMTPIFYTHDRAEPKPGRGISHTAPEDLAGPEIWAGGSRLYRYPDLPRDIKRQIILIGSRKSRPGGQDDLTSGDPAIAEATGYLDTQESLQSEMERWRSEQAKAAQLAKDMEGLQVVEEHPDTEVPDLQTGTPGRSTSPVVTRRRHHRRTISTHLKRTMSDLSDIFQPVTSDTSSWSWLQTLRRKSEQIQDIGRQISQRVSSRSLRSKARLASTGEPPSVPLTRVTSPGSDVPDTMTASFTSATSGVSELLAEVPVALPGDFP